MRKALQIRSRAEGKREQRRTLPSLQLCLQDSTLHIVVKEDSSLSSEKCLVFQNHMAVAHSMYNKILGFGNYDEAVAVLNDAT